MVQAILRSFHPRPVTTTLFTIDEYLIIEFNHMNSFSTKRKELISTRGSRMRKLFVRRRDGF